MEDAKLKTRCPSCRIGELELEESHCTECGMAFDVQFWESYFEEWMESEIIDTDSLSEGITLRDALTDVGIDENIRPCCGLPREDCYCPHPITAHALQVMEDARFELPVYDDDQECIQCDRYYTMHCPALMTKIKEWNESGPNFDVTREQIVPCPLFSDEMWLATLNAEDRAIPDC